MGELSGGQLRLDPALVDSENLFEMPAGTGATKAFIVPQPQQRDGQNRDRREGRDNREGRGNGNSFSNKNGKKRKKGRSQEPQQPPQ